MRRNSIFILLCYIATYIIWGTTFYATKISVESITPLAVLSLRWATGAFVFLLLCAFAVRPKALPSKNEVLSAFIMSILMIVIPNTFFTVALKKADSYIAALLCAMSPVVVALSDTVFLRKRVPAVIAAGIAAGLAGVALLLYDGRSVHTTVTPEVFMMAAGLCSWGIGTSISHRMKTPANAFVNTGLQMAFGGLILLCGALMLEPGAFSALGSASIRSLSAVAYLGTMGAVTFGAYNYLLNHEPAVRVSTNSLVNPAIAILVGMLIGGETATPYFAFGIPALFAGLALMLYGEALLERVKTRASLWWGGAEDSLPD